VYRDATPTEVIFKGFLIVADMSESFMPHPRELELVANDGLGLLKDIPLTDLAGDVPTGYNRLAEYLAWSLSKTGLSLNINVINNIMEAGSKIKVQAEFHAPDNFDVDNDYEDFFYVGMPLKITGTALNNITTTVTDVTPGGPGETNVEVSGSISSEPVEATFQNMNNRHFYHGVYLDAKTFEAEINIFEDCYAVIEKILGESCQLFQRNGEWWVIRIDEIATDDYYVATFNSSGQITTEATLYAFDKEIGKDDQVVFFSGEATRVRTEMAHKELKLTYSYSTPLENPCNSEFSRGDFIADLPDETIEGITYDAKSYQVDCWTYVKFPFSPDDLTNLPDDDAYVKRLFVGDYEKQRFVVLPLDTDLHSLFSEAIYMDLNDKINISIDFRGIQDLAFPGPVVVPSYYVWLDADDGTNWFLWGDGNWYESDVTWTTNFNGIRQVGDPLIDNTVFWPAAVESKACPVSGNLYISLNNADNDDIDANNISIEYLPIINSSYRQYTGQQHLVTQDLDNKVRREKEVYISDSPKRLFKGALLIFVGTGYTLAGLFYDGAKFPAGLPSSANQFPFGEIQAFDVWNQMRIDMRIFDAQCQGIDSGATDVLNWVDMVSLLHKFLLVDADLHTNNRKFKMLTNTIIWDKAEWSGVLREVYNTIKGKNYTGHTFKYLS
jgi:hypothetical protein